MYPDASSSGSPPRWARPGPTGYQAALSLSTTTSSRRCRSSPPRRPSLAPYALVRSPTTTRGTPNPCPRRPGGAAAPEGRASLVLNQPGYDSPGITVELRVDPLVVNDNNKPGLMAESAPGSRLLRARRHTPRPRRDRRRQPDPQRLRPHVGDPRKASTEAHATHTTSSTASRTRSSSSAWARRGSSPTRGPTAGRPLAHAALSQAGPRLCGPKVRVRPAPHTYLGSHKPRRPPAAPPPPGASAPRRVCPSRHLTTGPSGPDTPRVTFIALALGCSPPALTLDPGSLPASISTGGTPLNFPSPPRSAPRPGGVDPRKSSSANRPAAWSLCSCGSRSA